MTIDESKAILLKELEELELLQAKIVMRKQQIQYTLGVLEKVGTDEFSESSHLG